MAPMIPKALATPIMAFSPGLMVVLDVEVDDTPVELVWLVGDDDAFRRAGEVVDVEVPDISLGERTVLVDWEVVGVGTV